MPDPSVSPADTNPGATIAEVLILTEGYLDDGYGAADLRERLAKARRALDALLAVGERREQHIERLTVAIEDYLLWEPGKAGHAEAHRRLRAAVLADKEDAGNG